MSSPLIRSALMVRDLNQSRRFYEAVIGLTAAYLDADLSSTIAWKLLGVSEGSGVRCVILKPPEIAGKPAPNFGMVGLFELDDSDLSELSRRTDGIVFGEAVLVFYIEDMARCLDLVKSHGGQVLTGPEEFRIPNARASEAIVRDPDGVAINLVEASDAVAW
jgi:catechol 2,3-dioxygenase-like lactoylglutathione lyase family enzyme